MGSRWLLLIPIPSYLGLIWLFMQLLNLVEMTNVLMSKIYAFVIHFTLMSLLCCLDLYNLARLTSITTRIKGEDIRAKHKGGSTRCKNQELGRKHFSKQSIHLQIWGHQIVQRSLVAQVASKAFVISRYLFSFLFGFILCQKGGEIWYCFSISSLCMC